MKQITFFLILLFYFSGCHQNTTLKLATSIQGSATEKIGTELAEYLNDNNWKIKVIEGIEVTGTKGIEKVINEEVDLAFVQNDMAYAKKSNEICTVLPFYPNISYIFYRNNLRPSSLNDLVTDNSVLVSADDEYFYRNLIEYYGINTDSVDFNFYEMGNSVDEFITQINNGDDDVICVFAAIHNPYVKEMIHNNWEIFSLGDITYSNKGSSVEGFCMNYPRSEPFIVPRNFFGQKPVIPIYTIALKEVLIAKKDADETMIYDLVNTIYSGKHLLGQKDLLFTHLQEDFDKDALNFPLHQATINYLNRDAPSFFERYAEAFGVVFSILVVLTGGLTSLKKIRKERIDKYYKRVMNCSTTKELEEISNEAVRQLQNEKLTADESFTILLSLVDKRRNEIQNDALQK